jgi:AraC family transcriptional regulator, alkane utilization regulator
VSSAAGLGERFTRLIGMAPMRYLANWRMQVAAQELRNSSASLAEVAITIGYESEAAFSRAFKKAFRTAPATWRRFHNRPDEYHQQTDRGIVT